MVTGRHHQIGIQDVLGGEPPPVARLVLGVLLAAMVMRFTIFLIHWMGG